MEEESWAAFQLTPDQIRTKGAVKLSVTATTDVAETFSEVERQLIGSYFTVISILGVSLNLLTIVTIGFGKNISKQVKIQLINLAVADVIMAALYPPYLRHFFLQTPLVNTVWECRIYFFFAISALHASPFCSAAISLERVVIVLFPLRISRYTTTHKLLVVGLIWFISCVPEFVYTFYEETLVYHGVVYCDVNIDSRISYAISVTYYLLPLIIIVVSYSLVFVTLCKRKRSKLVQNSSCQDSTATDKLLLMLVLDAFLTLFTWMPMKIYYAFSTSDAYEREGFIIKVTLSAIFATNVFSTPIVYFIFNKYFRMDVCHLFKRISSKLMRKNDGSDGAVNVIDMANSSENSAPVDKT